MARLVSSVSDVLDTLQKERGGARARLKADLQRAPARGARPRGCSNGEQHPWQCLGRGVCLGLLVAGGKPPRVGQSILEKGYDTVQGLARRWRQREMERCVLEGGVLTVQLPVVHKPAQKPLHTPANPSAPHRASRDTGRAFTSIGMHKHIAQCWVEMQLSLSWSWEHVPRASLGIGLSPSGSHLALAITQGRRVSPYQLLGSPHGGGISPGTAHPEHRRRREGKSKAAPSWQLELEARLGAWKKWQGIELDH